MHVCVSVCVCARLTKEQCLLPKDRPLHDNPVLGAADPRLTWRETTSASVSIF